MNSAIAVFVSLTIVLSLGYFCLIVLMRNKKLPLGMILPISYALGMGIISYGMFFLGMLNIPMGAILPQSFLLRLLWAFVFGIIVLYHRIKTKNCVKIGYPQRRKSSQRLRIFYFFEIGLCIFIALELGFIFFHSIAYPIYGWDPVATSSLKAKVFVYDQSLLKLNLPHASYPLLMPLMQAWEAFNLGGWHASLTKIFNPMAVVMMLLAIYSFLRQYTERIYSLAGAALLLTSNMFVYHSTMGYRDVLMGFYFLMTVLVLLLSRKYNDINLLILSAVLAGFMSFVKLEGNMYLVLFVLGLSIFLYDLKDVQLIEKVKYGLVFILISFGMCSIFYGYKVFLGVQGMSGRLMFSVADNWVLHLQKMFDSYLDTFFTGGNWGLLWVLLFLSICMNFKRLIQCFEIRYLSLMICLFLCMYSIFFQLTTTEIDYFTTVTRILLHVYPLCVVVIVMLNAPLNQEVVQEPKEG